MSASGKPGRTVLAAAGVGGAVLVAAVGLNAGLAARPAGAVAAAPQTVVLGLGGDGTVWSWGDGKGTNLLGDGVRSRLSPARIPGLTGVVQLASRAATLPTFTTVGGNVAVSAFNTHGPRFTPAGNPVDEQWMVRYTDHSVANDGHGARTSGPTTPRAPRTRRIPPTSGTPPAPRTPSGGLADSQFTLSYLTNL